MGERVWSWFLELAPARDAVRREVKVAVDLVMDATEQAQARQRERHRIALGRTERQLVELRARADELTATNAELARENESLRARVAELEEAARQEIVEREEFAQRVVREQEVVAARQWHGTSTDVFCCQSCWAFWLLSTPPDRTSCVVRGPFGRRDAACTVCAEPLVVLPAAKSVVFRKQTEDRISRPEAVADGASDVAMTRAGLAAIADGLGRLPKVRSRTVAWVATGLAGQPELSAEVLGEVAGRETMPVPLDGIIAGVRAFVDAGAQVDASRPSS